MNELNGNEPSVDEFDEDEFIDECNERTTEILTLLESNKFSARKTALEKVKEFSEWLENNYLLCGKDTRLQVKNLLNQTREQEAELEQSVQKPGLKFLKETTPNPNDPPAEPAPNTAPNPARTEAISSGTQTETSNTTRTVAPERSGEESQPAAPKRTLI